MEDFCGSEFWNASLSWNATTHPDFTPCFEKTVLVWIPCLFLWAFAPVETHHLIRSRDRNIPWSFLNVAKIIISCILLIVELVLLIYNISNNTEENIYGTDFLMPSLLFISIFLQLIIVIMEKKRGIQSSYYLFIFWLLMTVCGIFPYRSYFIAIDEDGVSTSVGFITYMVYFPLVVFMFLLNCFADRRPSFLYHPRGKKACPGEDASFPSRITFSWLDGLVWKGYRKPITQEMLWDLSYANSSAKVTKDWDRQWEKTVRKSVNKSESHSRATYAKNNSQIQMVGTTGSRHYLSILPTMLRSFGLQFMFGSVLKLVHDLLQFVSPFLIKLLIGYTEDQNQPWWRGYLYAVILLIVTQLQSLFLGQYFLRMFIVGLKIRTAIISAVYRKALRISNSARKESTVGEIVNLMSVDAQRFMDLVAYLNMIWSAPLQISLCIFFLWQILGPSVLAGLAVMIILIPINGYIANKQKMLQISQMKQKDERVKLMNEILNGIKVLKLYAWEPSFEDQVLGIRSKEIRVLRKAAYLNAFTSFIWTCTPFMVTFFMFMTFVLTDPSHILTPEIVFVSITLLNIMRMPMTILPYLLIGVVQASVSLKRMNKFINADELDPNAVNKDSSGRAPILVENGTFTWGHGEEDREILKNVSLKVEEGALVGVVGSVGAGKSSLFSAILGEMEKVSGRVSIKGSVAFVPQQAWIQNATLEDNILFGGGKDGAFYDKVVNACALKADFDMLPAGDQTEIGEKGINLSGGQKQRVSVARAVYSDAQVFLLDDPLSAVDSHVGKHIFEKVIGPQGMLRNKTRILITHGLTYLRHMDHIVVLKNGGISEQGTYAQLIANRGEFQEFLLQYLSKEEEQEEEALDEIKSELEKTMGRQAVERQISRKRAESECSSDGKGRSNEFTRSGSSKRQGSKQSDGDKLSMRARGSTAKQPGDPKVGEKLIETEKAETGKVSMAVYIYYARAIGIITSILTIFFYAASQGFSVGSNVWLSKWSEDETATEPDVRNKYLSVYGVLGILQAVSIVLGFIIIAYASMRAAKILHNNVLQNVLRSPASFFDMTPIGRIVNRFGKDLDTIDVLLPMNIRSLVLCLVSVVATLAIISYTTPIFVAVLIPTMIIYYFVQVLYVTTSRQLKRIESVSRSPIYSHFGETIQGASTIRAYGKTNEFILDSERKVDFNQVSYYPSIIANRWLAIRLEFVGNILTFFAALFAVMSREKVTGGEVGLSVSYALSVTQTLNWLVRMTSDVETSIVAVERVKEYTETPQEAPWQIPDKKPDQNWPDKGLVRFEKYSTRYRNELDLVIKGINCDIQPKEKIGIVGRTGAGKSSLTLALFRIIEAAGGKIVIDGVDISSIGLHDLREKLTIIPQDPVLFSGTLRMNLDPFNKHSDQTVWDALEHSHLKNFVVGFTSKLQHEISEGGENLSVGQRQLVCLARALLRKTKVLVLDEATAAVDLETDELLQETIRREFADCTILTIAHRLNTIMDSTRVLVMDKGQIQEFDTPSNLLANPQSFFFSMAKQAGLV